MATLYIDHKNYSLGHDAGRLLLQDADGKRGIPLHSLERVVVHGSNTLDTRLLHALSEQRIPLICIHPRHSDKTAHIGANHHAQASRRLAQYRLLVEQPTLRLSLSRRLITAKVKNQYQLLQEAREARPDRRKPLSDGIATLHKIHSRLQNEEPLGLDQLRGNEGAAAAAYFAAYQTLFAPSLEFVGRNRRPPRDPVNACLSLAYTLLHHDAISACHITGLDPLLGYFHDLSYNRESLASDLIEPLRPHVDRWVWELFRTRQLEDRHFSRAQQACLLDKAGRKLFYQQWELSAPPLRRHLRLHGYGLVKALRPLMDPDNSEEA